MATAATSPILRYIHRIAAGRTADLSDGQLLDRFASCHDEAAFAALVQRHGPLVHNVCRRVLADWHAAQDAFQETFLVLARKAGALARPGSLGAWLHGVAYRTALKARCRAARRRGHERQVAETRSASETPVNPESDLRPAIDEAVASLPEKYRAPLVLCYLEGKTVDETARLLGWPRGTVATRLARARDRLRRRLLARGLSLSAGFGLVAVPAAVPATVPAAVPTSTGGLAKGVLKLMSLTKFKVALLVLALGAGGAGVLSHGVFVFGAGQTGQAVQGDRKPRPGTARVSNSKVFYVTIVGAGATSQIYRLPFTGAETVLDALASLPDLTGHLTKSEIRVVRVGRAGGPEQTLTVDWRGITQRGEAKTNYALQAGDRICVVQKRAPVSSAAKARPRAIKGIKGILGPESFNRLFETALEVVEDLFGGVAYANRYEGRIESDSAVPARKGVRPSIRRRAVLNITCPGAGEYEVEVKVFRERRVTHVRGTEPGTAEIAWQADGRDTELERVILRRLDSLEK
jgi:RNA polymerase sigma factor (sigma-70 family)